MTQRDSRAGRDEDAGQRTCRDMLQHATHGGILRQFAACGYQGFHDGALRENSAL